MRECNRCRAFLPASEYYASPGRKDGLYPTCKPCKRGEYAANRAVLVEKQRQRRLADPRKYINRDLLRTYDITLQEYEEAFNVQGGLCAICRMPERAKTRAGSPRRLAVDHDKITGKNRGLLCTACNQAIGCLGHNVELLKAAIKYLEETDATPTRKL